MKRQHMGLQQAFKPLGAIRLGIKAAPGAVNGLLAG